MTQAGFLEKLERFDQAEAVLREAIAAVGSISSKASASARFELGGLLVRTGRAREGLDLIEPAWAVLRREQTQPSERGRTAIAMAQALWAGGGDHERALALAEQGVEDLERADPSTAAELERARQWLRVRR